MNGGMRRGLQLIAAEDTLNGEASAFLERFARKLKVDSAQHIGWLAFLNTITPSGYRGALPPSVRGELDAAHAVLHSYIRGRATLHALKKARSDAFNGANAAEQKAITSVLAAQRHLETNPNTLLDTHALRVVERYAGLAAHHAVAAICHCLDAAEEPAKGLRVLADISASRAYQAAGLGAARHFAFRVSALEQAEWELTRKNKKTSKEEILPLAGQIFHEYLGARWKSHQQVEVFRIEEFARWALASGL